MSKNPENSASRDTSDSLSRNDASSYRMDIWSKFRSSLLLNTFSYGIDCHSRLRTTDLSRIGVPYCIVCCRSYRMVRLKILEVDEVSSTSLFTVTPWVRWARPAVFTFLGVAPESTISPIAPNSEFGISSNFFPFSMHPALSDWWIHEQLFDNSFVVERCSWDNN